MCGRHLFSPSNGRELLITLLLFSLNNPGLLRTAASLITAAVIGVGFAQSKEQHSETLRSDLLVGPIAVCILLHRSPTFRCELYFLIRLPQPSAVLR